MSAAQIIVTLVGGLTIAVLARFFFRSRSAVEAVEQAGVQEVRVVVRGGYSPDVIRARTGLPVRIIHQTGTAIRSRGREARPGGPHGSACANPGCRQ